MAGTVGATEVKNCEVTGRVELDIQPRTTENDVECNATLD